MCRRAPALFEFANENGKRWTDKCNQPKQPEAIEEGKNSGLLLHESVNLSYRTHGGISGGISVVDEAIRNPLQVRRKALIKIRNVAHQN